MLRMLRASGFVRGGGSAEGAEPGVCGFTRGQVPLQDDVMPIKRLSEQQPGRSAWNQPHAFGKKDERKNERKTCERRGLNRTEARAVSTLCSPGLALRVIVLGSDRCILFVSFES